MVLSIYFVLPSVKTSCSEANYVVSGGTVGSFNDNLLCHQCGQVSIMTTVGFQWSIPLNTWLDDIVVITSKWRHFDVITSKWRRFDVITTSLLRNMSAGMVIVTGLLSWWVPILHSKILWNEHILLCKHIFSNAFEPLNILTPQVIKCVQMGHRKPYLLGLVANLFNILVGAL